ncbi:hypothetical protein KW868_06550 [Acinetobacter guillouiae]|uniref:Uncharacterized protein n=1 Tax=Acinetobacter guillouiae TaxID=106649 RepID=A0A8X8KDZ7_ACIGI|nr:hypothetical protein [Acinetobacter guillouiae]MCF0264130.1 hypothetical protein [Acinetobacter guillouiae]
MKRLQIVLNTALLLIAGNSFAVPYQRCSGQQQQQLIQQFKLVNQRFANTEAKTYQSCIHLDNQQKIQLIAISQPIAYKSYDDMEHDLNLYLIDSSQHKILQKYKAPETFYSDADHYDGAKLHSTRFSTLPNTDVVGLETSSSHEGGFTYSHNNLALFKVNPRQPIKQVFAGIGTNNSGYERIGNCVGNNTSSDVRRILVLSNKTTHGLQDIVLKETKDQTKTNYKTCTSVKKQYKQQQTIKFNGQVYKLQHNDLLGIDPF